VGLFACVAQATPVGAGGDTVKYTQPPQEVGGFDFASQVNSDGYGFVMLDDWICPDGKPITDIHWWGSYWTTPAGGPVIYSDGLANANPIEGLDFEIGIFSDIPADDPENPNGFSIPNLDDLLLDVVFFDVSPTYAFTETNVLGSATEDVYSYSVDLPKAFDQTQGQVYWLGILALADDSCTQWGWHNSCTQTGDFAVQASLVDGDIGEFYIPCGGVDMAFQLTTVPEPGSFLALGAGLSGLLAFVVRKRRIG